jgi:hypothetical protein
MNIELVWDNDEKTILRYIYGRSWTWADFNTAAKEAYEMLDAVEHKVSIIMDFQNANIIPQGAITHVQRAFSTPRHANISTTVIVGSSANTFLQAIAGVGRKLSRSGSNDWQLTFVSTLPEAYAALAPRDKAESQ